MVDSAESGINNESQGQVEQPARVLATGLLGLKSI